MGKNEEFHKRILATFKVEAYENVSTLTTHLVELENESNSSRKQELLEVIYRGAHSLKGAARAVGFHNIERLCHSTEDLMSAIRNNEISITPQFFDILFQTSDLIEEILSKSDEVAGESFDEQVSKQLEFLSLAEAGLEFESDFVRNTPTEEKELLNEKQEKFEVGEEEILKETGAVISRDRNRNNEDFIRVSSNKLDMLLAQAEEMLSLKLMANQRTDDLKNILSDITQWNRKSLEVYAAFDTIKRNVAAQNSKQTEKELNTILDFHNWSNGHLKNIEKELGEAFSQANEERFVVNAKVGALLEDVKELIAVPFSTVLDGFPKMVRDISKDLGKEVTITIAGDTVEIDRRILEQMRNPLMHLLRNAIDYGIELPEERIKCNKIAKGNIQITIEQLENNRVEIVVSDDGRGINLGKLRQIYAQNEKVDALEIADEELIKYIFRSGVTTSSIVTDLSGRGLGMSIVQETIDQLGGKITVDTISGKSTSFSIELPLSIVTYRGVLVEVSDRLFIVPSQKVHTVTRVAVSEIKTVGNKATIVVDKELVPLVNMNDVLELKSTKIEGGSFQVIVFEVKSKKMGFAVDKILGEQEALVKKFNKQLTRIRNISGASILGSGEVVPILNISDLYKSALTKKFTGSSLTSVEEQRESSQRNVLIVEDSITSRTLLKNILETSGYEVAVAVDGVDGYTKLKEGAFDVVVTDVEMPRMNGFELTEKIRNDKELEKLPVVLVTSLSKREDRERGIDVGANAYIIKSSFEQSNLLEVLDRLVI